MRVRKVTLMIAAPALALLFAVAVTSVILIATGHPPLKVFSDMWNYAQLPDQRVNILNKATTYYLSAVAVAIGFRMNLFNIGVDGPVSYTHLTLPTILRV